jgi:hypothetical protein
MRENRRTTVLVKLVWFKKPIGDSFEENVAPKASKMVFFTRAKRIDAMTINA